MTVLTTDDVPITRVPRGTARLTVLVASVGFFLITLDVLVVNVASTHGPSGARRHHGESAVGDRRVHAAVRLAAALRGPLSECLGAQRAIGWASGGN